MSDSAKAPLTGYLFQFEKALLLLSSLENTDDYISIEDVDDIATHKENGTVIFSIQAKHSISKTGTTFEDTSYSLWRTLQIWINKLEAKTFNNTTTFVCSTNKAIPNESLLHLIQTDIFDNVVLKIEKILKDQKQKLAKKIIKFPNGGKSILETINLIEFVLSKKDTFKIIQTNIKIEDEENVKEKFFNKLHLNSDKYSDTIRNNIFLSYYGWISYSSSAIWKQSSEAKFSKKLFDEQWANIISNSAIVNNVFRTKELLGPISDSKIKESQSELFVKQIEDIPRRKESQDRIIKKAINDFIYSQIEMSYIVKKGDFTEQDFENFMQKCKETWQSQADIIVVNEIVEYDEAKKNELAITLFDKIMNNIEIKFKDGFSFTTNNEYLRNGSFLQLSNIPSIGWHPEWKNKYN